MDVAAESISSSLNLSANHLDRRSKDLISVKRSLPEMKAPTKTRVTAKRLLLTVSMYLVYYGMGQNSGLLGPTLVQLEYLFNTTTSHISQVVMWMNVGYLIGSVICISVFDRINHELQFCFWAVLSGVSTFLIPWMPSVYGYFVLAALQFASHGVMYSGGQVLMLKLWSESRVKRPVIQATHMMWSLGAFICPFLCIPFLVELNNNTSKSFDEIGYSSNLTNTSNFEDSSNTCNFSNLTQSRISSNGTEIGNETQMNKSCFDIVSNTSNSHVIGNFNKVRYAYGIVGITNFLGGVFFLIAAALMGPKCAPYSYEMVNPNDDNVHIEKKHKAKSAQGIFNSNDHSTVKLLKVIILIIILTVVTLFFWHETILGSYISAFAVKGLKWSSQQGALLTSVFYGCHGLGRVSGVLISQLLLPTKVLLINMTLTVISLSLLLLSSVSKVIVFMGTAVAGFFISTTFPSLILWLSEYMVFTGFLGGLFMAGGSLGIIIIAPVVGYLFETYTHMWVVYISSGSALVCLCLFLVLVVLGKVMSKYKASEGYIIEEELKVRNKL